MKGLALATLLVGLPAWAGAELGAFKPAGALKQARYLHTATKLKDGRVLVVGGRGVDGTVELDSVELYDPKKNRWAAGPKLPAGRSGHTATLLADGRVLVAGGTTHEMGAEGGSRFVAVATVELFDPKANQWKAGAPMAQARNWHTANLLDDGRVLVAGGAREQKSHLATAELYDPGKDAWTPAAAMKQSRCLHQAVKLSDGAVLVVGGRSNQDLQAPKPEPAADAGMAQRPHGESKAAAGFGAPIASAERWSPDGGWAVLPEPVDPRQRHALVALPEGRAMVVGGSTRTGLTNLAEVWTPDAGAWATPEHSLSMGLGSHTATALGGGDVLVIGGEPPNSVDTDRAQRYEAAGQRWCLAGVLVSSRKQHTATLLDSGKVLVVGGVSAGVSEPTAELWEPRQGKCEEPPGPSLEW